jgi:hypothetical protein
MLYSASVLCPLSTVDCSVLFCSLKCYVSSEAAKWAEIGRGLLNLDIVWGLNFGLIASLTLLLVPPILVSPVSCHMTQALEAEPYLASLLWL